MNPDELRLIGGYMMPEVPMLPSDLGFLFGTRHGVEEFCRAALSLWERGMFRVLLVSGGPTAGNAEPEAAAIARRLKSLGMPASSLILETAAMNTGDNVILGLRKLDEVMDRASVRSVLAIGKVCSMRRYLMTLERHWPGLAVSACPVNYFGVEIERWHEHEEFRRRVLADFHKIPAYLQQGFLSEVAGYPSYPRSISTGDGS
jgi:uncharacterized SAM-binding protein YcdF (DUF218 family)